MSKTKPQPESPISGVPKTKSAASVAELAAGYVEPDHFDLKFVTVAKRLTLIDFDPNDPSNPPVTRTVTVEIQAAPNKNAVQKDTLIFTVIISRRPATDTVTYSLLTLGVQAIEHDVFISAAKASVAGAPGNDPEFYFPGAANPIPLPASGKMILGTGFVMPDPAKPKIRRVNPEGVAFISFTGDTCELTVEIASGPINAARIGLTGWSDGTFSEGHDNTPPPDPY